MLLLLPLLVVAFVLGSQMPAFAAWTSLVTAADFTGITTDVQTTATGVITVMLVVLGVGLLMRVFTR